MVEFEDQEWCLNCEAVTANVMAPDGSDIVVFYCVKCNEVKGKKIIRNGLDMFY